MISGFVSTPDQVGWLRCLLDFYKNTQKLLDKTWWKHVEWVREETTNFCCGLVGGARSQDPPQHFL